MPIYGLIKGALCLFPCTLFLTICVATVSVVLLPVTAFWTYRAVITTAQWGPNIKVIACILLPVFLVLWPCLATLLAALFSLLYCLAVPVKSTFDESENFCYGGIAEVYHAVMCQYPRLFVECLWVRYYEFTEEFRHSRGREVFDVPFYWIFLCPLLSAAGACIALPAACVMTVIKIIPALARAYYFLWCRYCELGQGMMIMFVLLFALANALVPFLVALAAAAFVVFSAGLGATATCAAYNGGAEAGFRRMVTNVYDLDEFSNAVAFQCHSCLPWANFGESAFHTSVTKGII
ncbi:MAG: hypothetical protein P4L95_00095 [Rouxiella aceris]|uniref:hypothetical protein n=1 Tax=Rouxiella aceris TaxID=2703884 RepID=UPI00283E9BA9|nr:hypothetical protein [Rouxiella aceris]MDR3430303.1 hypothetical protein [Rouxiella aceris]